MAEATGRFGTLRFQSAEGRERIRLLEQPSNMLGRGPQNDIVIEDESIAIRHARLTIESGRLIVEDLGSGTGTFLDGHPISPRTPTMVEDEQELRFGNIATRFDAPARESAEAAAVPSARRGSPEAAPELGAAIRVNLFPPAEALQAGGGPAIARLQVTNMGRVVDQLSVSVLDLPPEWVRINNPELVLTPNETSEVSVAIQVPRRSESAAGVYEFSIVVSSAETGREVFASGTVELRPHYESIITLRPRRSKKSFEVQVENHGNAPLTYGLRGRDDDELLQFDFKSPSIAVEPGQTERVAFDAICKKRWFGKEELYPFNITLTSTTDSSVRSETSGYVVSHPPLQRLVFPSILAFVILAGVLGALLFFFWPFGDDDATAEDLLSLVHPMCDPENEEEDAGEQIVRTGGSGTQVETGDDLVTLYAQNDIGWADDEYAMAQDPDFGPDWCGDTIAQCGCAMSSMANVMSVLSLATMPDGTELNPRTLNEWLNLNAVRDSRGWVSQGYAYGNVLWTAANQLSAEMAEEFGTPTIRFNGWGPGDDGFIRSELEARRPVVLEIPGHFIAAYGIDQETNQILIYDPYYPDRATIDFYHERGIPIRGSRLFEPSDDLSGVLITSPRDVRIKVTLKATGEEVGTLNTASADEAADRARVEVEGAGYLSAPAWRDPTCTEREPPAEAGTNQIWLPGSIDDYNIEYLNTTDQVPTVAVHSYNEDGEVEILLLEGAPTGQIQSFDPDPDGGSPTPDDSETPDGSETPETTEPGITPPTSTGPGGGTGGGPSPTTAVPGETTTVPPVSPTTAVPGGTTPAGPPVTPVISSMTCNVAYQENPKLATVTCNSAVTGTTTSLSWLLNNVPAGTGLIMNSAQFTQNTNLTALFTACNGASCANMVRAVAVQFPTGGTPTPTNTATATPTGGTTAFTDLDLVCTAGHVPNVQSNINCTASFTDAFTSIAWTAPGTNNPSQITGVKTFNTSVNNGSPVFAFVPGAGLVSAAQSSPEFISHTFIITANVCNGGTCRSMQDSITIFPKYRELSSFDLFDFCFNNQTVVQLSYNFDTGAPPEWETQLFFLNAQFFVNGSPATLAPPDDSDGLWWNMTLPSVTSSVQVSVTISESGNVASHTFGPITVFDACTGA